MDLEQQPTNKINNGTKNEEIKSEEDIYFYIMTLQADGERHQIKIFKNSNASELAFNFCKEYNMDFQTMKYLKKCIKKIILNFDSKRKNEMIYLLKDNSSIQEVAEEEIITDNSLKKSGTYKKPSSNNTLFNSNSKSKNSKIIQQKNPNLQINTNNTIDNIDKYNIGNEKEKPKKIKNTTEVDDKINLKDYSIDYCIDNNNNDSIDIFQPTEHTTKVEQRSSIRNSYSMNKNKKELNDKKKNSKNKKLQIINNNTLNINRIKKRQNYPIILGKNSKKKSTKELKNLIYQYKDKKDKNIIEKSKSKSKSREKKYEHENEKKNNPIKFHRNSKTKSNSKTSFLDSRKNDILKFNKNINNNIKQGNKYEKFLTSMNEKKNKYISNYYDYFIKTKNINNKVMKYQTSYSINQDSNRSKSKSISKKKMIKNMTQRINIRNKDKIKKERNNISSNLNTLNSYNPQKNGNNSKINLNIILKKDGNSKEKKRTVFKNKIKTKYNIIINKNNNLFNKTINNQYISSKIKNISGKELFIEPKKKKSSIRKMVTESLLNIHKYKDFTKYNNERKKNMNILINNKIIRTLNNKSKNNKSKDAFFKNESGIEKSMNFVDKLYFDSGN
jgi:hypothetical protein